MKVLLFLILINTFAADLFPFPPVRQWTIWEELANVSYMRQTTDPVCVKCVTFPEEEVVVDVDEDFSIDFLKTPEGWSFPVHPFAQDAPLDPPIPGMDKDPSGKEFHVQLTASRSLALQLPGRLVSLKLPTNSIMSISNPNYFSFFHLQTQKSNLSKSVLISRSRANLIKNLDCIFGMPDNFLCLRDTASLSLKSTGNGIVIRDLTPMEDGSFYLPATAIPYVGPEIAEINGQNFAEFWEHNYARLLGKAKAQIILRYGIQFLTPNAQNMLLKLNPQTFQVEKMFFRDLSDTRFVRFMSENYDLISEKLALEDERGHSVDNVLHPYWENSCWRFNEDEGPFGPNSSNVSMKTLHRWGAAHSMAYFDEIVEALNISQLPKLNKSILEAYREKLYAQRGERPAYSEVQLKEFENSARLGEWLQSPEGSSALYSYRTQLTKSDLKRARDSF